MFKCNNCHHVALLMRKSTFVNTYSVILFKIYIENLTEGFPELNQAHEAVDLDPLNLRP